jgi:hypothetical protein
MLLASSLEWASDMLGDLLSNLHFPHFHLLLQKSSGLRGPTSPYSLPLPALIVRKTLFYKQKHYFSPHASNLPSNFYGHLRKFLV